MAAGAGMRTDALVIGGGPAGLMAAEALAGTGRSVLLAEAMPTPGRKLLMAGKSGLNLTHDAPAAELAAACGAAAGWLAPVLADFDAAAVQDWARGLDQELFTGSTGRVFPLAMKASPLLRAWLARLAARGVVMRTRWRWRGWDGAQAVFDTPGGVQRVRAGASVLALGGASWARLGSYGAWAGVLAAEGVALAPFAPANFGLRVDWSPAMTRQFGKPLKGVAWHAAGRVSRGECVVSARGLEGGGLYGLGPALREGAALTLDLKPDLSGAEVARRLARRRRGDSGANHLRRALGLDPAARALLAEFARPLPEAPEALARLVKALPVAHSGPRPIDEAISVAGGIRAGALDAGLMLRARPGVFAAGEMLDWEAPTGGYLLSTCLATGRWAGRHAAAWLEAGN